MMTLILGKKGTGKTKKLLALCAEATEQSKGNVVFIEKDSTLTYNLSHKTRLVVSDEYGIADFDAFYGFIAGMIAGNYDITDVFVDSTLKIGGRDMQKLSGFLHQVAALCEKAGTSIVFSVSAEKEEIPEAFAQYIAE